MTKKWTQTVKNTRTKYILDTSVTYQHAYKMIHYVSNFIPTAPIWQTIAKHDETCAVCES